MLTSHHTLTCSNLPNTLGGQYLLPRSQLLAKRPPRLRNQASLYSPLICNMPNRLNHLSLNRLNQPSKHLPHSSKRTGSHLCPSHTNNHLSHRRTGHTAVTRKIHFLQYHNRSPPSSPLRRRLSLSFRFGDGRPSLILPTCYIWCLTTMISQTVAFTGLSVLEDQNGCTLGRVNGRSYMCW